MNLIDELRNKVLEHKDNTYTSEGEYNSEREYEEVQDNQLSFNYE